MRRTQRLTTIGVLAALLTMVFAVGVVAAPGHGADQLRKAGWDCFTAGPNDWTHCFPPGVDLTGDLPATVQVKVFDDVEGEPFLGTEILVRYDLYNGQPCPQDGGGPYEFLGAPPYFACHHFETHH